MLFSSINQLWWIISTRDSVQRLHITYINNVWMAVSADETNVSLANIARGEKCKLSVQIFTNYDITNCFSRQHKIRTRQCQVESRVGPSDTRSRYLTTLIIWHDEDEVGNVSQCNVVITALINARWRPGNVHRQLNNDNSKHHNCYHHMVTWQHRL